MDVLNNAIEIFDGSVSRKEIHEMSYRDLLIEIEHKGRYNKENAEYIANKKAEKQLKGIV